tara:strand:- start:152 stop:418 length:267 start_codon:yes stop_codon:yes gene_type:complete
MALQFLTGRAAVKGLSMASKYFKKKKSKKTKKTENKEVDYAEPMTEADYKKMQDAEVDEYNAELLREQLLDEVKTDKRMTKILSRKAR